MQSLNTIQSGTIITASPRSARALQQSYATAQKAAGHDVWLTPPIYDWDTWLHQLWTEHSFKVANAPLLLTSLQEKSLWKQMQREDAQLVVSPEGMAALAQQAYALLCSYEAHSSRNNTWEQADAERFRHWAANFEKECSRNQWLSSSRLESALTQAIHTRSITLPDKLHLAGFDRLTPAQQTFLAACKAAGTHIQDFEQESSNKKLRLVSATDTREEITACAWWARNLLSKNPDIRIGIIVPDVEAIRGEIERTFRHILMPQTEDILAAPAAMPFEFSLGQPLAQIPVIRAALLLLRWLGGPLREEEISWLVLSGFLSMSDPLPIAQFDARMRASGSLSMEQSLGTYIRSLSQDKSHPLSSLRQSFEALQQAAQANDLTARERIPGNWTDLVHHLLAKASWPGPSTADTVQFQAQKRWEHLLDEIALLDFDNTRLAYEDFLLLLELQASETIFAPESRNSPIQIMGPFESSGQHFDAIWFLGADDKSWPPRARPHPLLPPAIQRQYAMPHATAEIDWQLARTVTERLAATPEAIFSYPQRDHDGELRPSSLLAQFTTTAISAASLYPQDKHHTIALEEITEASAIIPWPVERTAGGSAVLKNQAACPFQAFASRRLRAEPLNRSEWGLSAIERGNLLHDVLQRFWSDTTRTRDDLKLLIQQDHLHETLITHIAQAFAHLQSNHSEDPWMRAYLQSEQHRLLIRLEEWFECEASREPFTVEACEQQLSNVSIGNLKLDLRADRIDQLPDGSRLLIDYKTGEVSPAAWQGDRPDEPQLPLYVTYGNLSDISGVLFAQIRAGKTRFIGRIRDAKTQLYAKPDNRSALAKYPYTESMRDEWSNALQNLAEDFLRGEATVDPKHDARTCRYCAFPGLCRVAEQGGITEEDEEVSDD